MREQNYRKGGEYIMNDTRYRELLDKERNKQITDLEQEELELLKKYEVIVAKQIKEGVQQYKDGLYQGAVDGDDMAVQKLEKIHSDEESDKRIEKVRKDAADEADRQAKEEEKGINPDTGSVKTGEDIDRERHEQEAQDEKARKDQEVEAKKHKAEKGLK